jgi:hypothetical protein
MASCTGPPFFQQSRRLGGGDGQVFESWDGAIRSEAWRSLRRGVYAASFSVVRFLYTVTEFRKGRLVHWHQNICVACVLECVREYRGV